ncbi:helix-turn-helix transcriptional regulator [Robiginitalea sp. SC105]|uniref:helix-turn-helix domain-containing protein n=1 Tax=Robiginitalea sp. SC105 TaxID=2762332 RepID=UPI001C8D2A1B|nr:helix-turn-helix transcriptional regulator [Robiginitalea sp. SC105]
MKITEVKFPKIYFISNNGDYRVIDIKKLFKKIELREGDFGYSILVDKDMFNSVELIDKSLAWKNVSQKMELPNGEFIDLYFHLDPIVTIQNSEFDSNPTNFLNYGKSIKQIRRHLVKISQEELGEKIGTDKQYISKVENHKTDLELKTLRKIYEIGLDKKVCIAHYDTQDVLKSFANSILEYKFLEWADEKKLDLKLIEGIGDQIKDFLIENEIKSNEDLSKIELEKLIELISSKHSLSFYHHPYTWPIQAKLIMNSDWVTLISLQKSISKSHLSNYSKIEKLAREEIDGDLYQIH